MATNPTTQLTPKMPPSGAKGGPQGAETDQPASKTPNMLSLEERLLSMVPRQQNIPQAHEAPSPITWDRFYHMGTFHIAMDRNSVIQMFNINCAYDKDGNCTEITSIDVWLHGNSTPAPTTVMYTFNALAFLVAIGCPAYIPSTAPTFIDVTRPDRAVGSVDFGYFSYTNRAFNALLANVLPGSKRITQVNAGGPPIVVPPWAG